MQAIYTEGPNNTFQVSLHYPGSAKPETITVTGSGAIQREVYFRMRKYITSKMISWLKQRLWAERFMLQTTGILLAEELIGKISQYQMASLEALCTVITSNAEKLKKLAPHKQSTHLTYYNNTILPIINDCAAMANTIKA